MRYGDAEIIQLNTVVLHTKSRFLELSYCFGAIPYFCLLFRQKLSVSPSYMREITVNEIRRK